jgi:hypothetical protein
VLCCTALAVTPLLTLLLGRLEISPVRTTLLCSIWGCVVSGVFLLAVFAVQDRAGELSRRVLLGQRISPVGVTLLFDFRADPVCLRKTDQETDAPSISQQGLYLGEAGGRIVVYDPVAHVTMRVPDEDFVLRHIPDMTLSATGLDPTGLTELCAREYS